MNRYLLSTLMAGALALAAASTGAADDKQPPRDAGLSKGSDVAPPKLSETPKIRIDEDPATGAEEVAADPADAEIPDLGQSPVKPAPLAENVVADDKKPAADPAYAGAVPTMAELRKEIEKLRADLIAMRAEIERLGTKSAEQATNANNQVASLAEKIKVMQDVVLDLQSRREKVDEELAASRKKLDDVTDVVTKNDDDLRRILQQVAEQDAAGKWKPKLNALSDSNGKPRPDVIRTVQGRLLIENNTGEERVLYVNGTPWMAIKGRSYIWVPVGTVTIATEGGVVPTPYDEWDRNPETKILELKFKF